MEWFRLQPSSIPPFAAFLLSFFFTLYLISVRGKSNATRLLTATLCAASCFLFTFFLTNSLYTSIWLYSISLTYLFTLVFLTLLLQFAYAFPENPFPRESRFVAGISVVLVGIVGSILVYNLVSEELIPSMLFPLIGRILLILTVWCLVVLIRKTYFFAQDSSSREKSRIRSLFIRFVHPGDYRAQATRAVAFLILLVLSVTLAMLLRDAGIVSENQFNYLTFITILAFLLGLVVVYINHTTEPTTIQVRLVGISLATTLAVLGTAGLLLYLPGDMAYDSGNRAPENQTIRFTPIPEGGYLVEKLPSMLDEEFGQRLDIDDGERVAIPLGFSFPLAGKNWSEILLDDNAVIIFTREAQTAEGRTPVHDFSRNLVATFHEDASPKLAPFFSRLNPSRGGGIYVNRTAGKVVVTWHEVPDYLSLHRNTFQVALDEKGDISYSYGGIHSQLRWGGIGLWPGETPTVMPVSFSGSLPQRIESNTALIEDYMSRYRQFAHKKMLLLTWLIFISTVFILLIFPLFLRESFIRPLSNLLNGVRQVNSGDLNTQVPVHVEDEIGYLARSFNQMTSSLRAAEEKLRAHAGELEAKVKERTADLEYSLNLLTTAQSQLIQQEKMASLGQLTAGIAHEIKNPLNFVNNFALLTVELTEELGKILQKNPDQPVSEVLASIEDILTDLKLNTEKIREHGLRADTIIRSMLLHTRNAPGTRIPSDINTLLGESVDLVFHSLRAQLPGFEAVVERNLDELNPQAVVAPHEIGRVFLNLINNAFQAVCERKRTETYSYTPKITVQTRDTEEYVEIRVIDNGPGITQSNLGRVFEPFFTTKPAGHGTGLGLSMAYEIITQSYGGTLNVESKPGNGATFIIHLPHTVPADQSRSQTPSSDERPDTIASPARQATIS